MLTAVKLEVQPNLELAVDLDQPIQGAQLKPLSASQLAKDYAGKEVEPHRFAFAELHQTVFKAGISDLLMAKDFENPLLGLGIDFDKLPDLLFPTDG